MNTAKTRATAHHISDPVTCSCHQGRFDPGSTEPFVLKRYRVLVMQNKWDKDEGRFIVEVPASGENDARNQAMEQVKERYPDACWLRTEAAA